VETIIEVSTNLSVRESRKAPNLLVLPVKRATSPSTPSKILTSCTNTPPIKGLKGMIIAVSKPRKAFSIVILLGEGIMP